MTGPPNVRFTHFGLFVRDVETMASFYRDLLGFVETDRGHLGDRELIFLSRDPDEHHQLIFVSGLTRPPAEEVVNQISFRIDSLVGLLDFARLLSDRAVPDLQSINHGNAWSVYFRDPEGNRIEIYVSSPWYISQPCRVPINIDRAAADIVAETEAWCRTQPGFAPAEVFRAKLAAKMNAVTRRA
jgi:catechol 2,3-dioxygenase